MTQDMTLELKFVFEKGKKHFGKRGKCWLPVFSPFPKVFSKASFLVVKKNLGFCGKGSNVSNVQYRLIFTTGKAFEK